MSEIKEQSDIDKKEDFDNKKTKYFSHLALQTSEALKLHKEAELWERKERKRDWGNVSEHCLVTAARVDVFADKLSFPEDLKKDLIIAAALHDFFKKGEKEIVTTKGLTWDSFEKASQESTNKIREAGFSERIVYLANSVGHGSFVETEEILKKETLSPEDVAYLVLHYIDDYTIGSDWTNPAELSSGNGWINDLDRRMDNNERNQRYVRLNEEGREYFDGETTFEAQRRIGHLVEERLATLVNEKSGQFTNSKDLPQVIDEEIKNRIESLV